MKRVVTFCYRVEHATQHMETVVFGDSAHGPLLPGHSIAADENAVSRRLLSVRHHRTLQRSAQPGQGPLCDRPTQYSGQRMRSPGLCADRYTLPPLLVFVVSILQVPFWIGFGFFVNFLYTHFHLHDVLSAQGIRVVAIAILALVIMSYSLFIGFITRQGADAYRVRTELALAHGIQQTLVPPVTVRAARFEIYGISKPSEKVGGDLVDALCLPNGDAIAYIADIAGHGLQAGILMGMLKTAVRTALLEAGELDAQQTLPSCWTG